MLIGISAVQATADLVSYQRTGSGLPMYPHGRPDPATLINMGFYDPATMWSDSQKRYLEGGPKPSSLLRDLQGVSNQIPQWVWLAAGGTLLVLGLMAMRKKTST
jgi:hypothetical protein